MKRYLPIFLLWASLAQASTNVLFWNDRTVDAYVTITFDVDGNQVLTTNLVLTAVLTNTSPTTPQNFAVTATTTSTVSMAWTASTTTGGCTISGYYVGCVGCPPVGGGSAIPFQIQVFTNGTNFTSSSLTPGNQYQYNVFAKDSCGNYSALSPAITAVANQPAAVTTTNWAESFGGANTDDGRAVAVDRRDGSVYLTGDFGGTVNFGGGNISSATGQGVMLAKYTGTGTYVFAKAPTGNGFQQGQAVAVATNGNVAVTGFFASNMNWGSGTITAGGFYDIFVALFNSAGSNLWSVRFGGTSDSNPGDESGYGVAFATNGDVYVGGSYNGSSVVFGTNTFSSTGGFNTLLARLSSANGTCQWANSFTGTAASRVTALAVDSNDNVYATGFYGGTINLGGGVLTNGGANDIFVVKDNQSGVFQWGKQYGGIGSDNGVGISVDTSSNVYVVGNDRFTVNFGGTVIVNSNASTQCGFVLKLNSAGSQQYIKVLGFTGTTGANAVASDPSNNVVVTGSFSGNADFGGGTKSANGAIGIWTVKYNSAGTWVWDNEYGNGVPSAIGYGAAMDNVGNSFFTGDFQSTMTFNGVPLTSKGLFDIVVFKLVP